jgi:hypothetical protein
MQRIASLFVLLLVTSCASSGGGARVNVDNDFWFGTVSGGSFVYIGVGFTQNGSSVSAPLAYGTTSSNVAYCCTLVGSINGYNLTMSDTDFAGDQIIISGRFNSSVTVFTGTTTFIINGVKDSFYTELEYSNELSSSGLEGLAKGEPASLAEMAALLR